MSPEERDELMEFILQSQSNAAQRHQEAMKELAEQKKQLGVLATITHNMVKVARSHSRRLDRLEGLSS